MCYSGKCQYETWEGGCRIRSFKDYEQVVGFNACFIGSGIATCDEEIKLYEDNKQFYDSLCKLTYEYKIVKF